MFPSGFFFLVNVIITIQYMAKLVSKPTTYWLQILYLNLYARSSQPGGRVPLEGLVRYQSNDLLGTFLSNEGAKRLGTPALAQCFQTF
jgi:hypothetical protein